MRLSAGTRRLVAVLVGVLVLLGGLALVLSALGARDGGAEVAPASGPGTLEPDRGARHLSGGDRAEASPADRPATSGAHRPVLLARDGAALGEDEHLHLLELGNVVVHFGSARPPAALRALQEELTGPYDPELAAAGQAVVFARRPSLGGDRVLATAWRRRLEASGPEAPELRAFAEAWLGQGATAAR